MMARLGLAEAPRSTWFTSSKCYGLYFHAVAYLRMMTAARMSRDVVPSQAIWCRSRQRSSKEVIESKWGRDRY